MQLKATVGTELKLCPREKPKTVPEDSDEKIQFPVLYARNGHGWCQEYISADSTYLPKCDSCQLGHCALKVEETGHES